MTLSIDEKIEIGLTDNKILLFRFDANLRKEVYQRLNEMQKRLLHRLSLIGAESVSQKVLKQLLSDIAELVDETYREIHQFTSADLNGLTALQTDALAKIYNEAVQFDLFNQVPNYRIKAIRGADLIAGTPLEGWWKKQGNDLTFRFNGVVRSGVLEGKSYHELVNDVKELMGKSRRGAETLVRTAVMKANDVAHEALRDENEDILRGEQHISTLDTRTSEVCRIRDGLAWDLEQEPIGGHKVPYQRPPIHPNCRSDLKLLLKSWKALGIKAEEIPESTRASMDGQVKSSMTYEDWLKTKSEQQQDDILGKGKAKLWRDGVITFRDMLDQTGRPLTLKELSSLYGSNKWRDFVTEQSTASHSGFNQNLQEWIDLGKNIATKHQHFIDEALQSKAPHEKIIALLQAEGVEFGGKVNVFSPPKEAEYVKEFQNALSRYPKSWVDKSNNLGNVFVKTINGKDKRPWHKFIAIEKDKSEWGFSFAKKKAKLNDSFVTIDLKSSLSWRTETHIHEFGHRLQNVMPELDRLFESFWQTRTQNDVIEKLNKYNIQYRGYEITKKDNFIDPYFGRVYYREVLDQQGRVVLVEKPLEMLTMTFQSILGGDPHRLKKLYEKDPDLFYLGLSLLARFK